MVLPMPEIDLDALLSDDRVEIGRGPLASNIDLRGTPEFDALETEFRKIETGGPGAVDWKTLNRATVEILRERSKDLVLASRLVYGLFREEGYKGLAVGLTIVHGMVDQHWEAIFPPVARERGRTGAFDWISEKIAPLVEGAGPTAEHGTFALVAHDRLVELDTLLGERLSRFPAAIGPLIRALRPYARDARQTLEAAAAPPPALADAAPPAVQSVSAVPEVAAQAAAPPTAEQKPPPVPSAVAPLNAPAANQPIAAVAIPVGDNAQQAFESLAGAALRIAGTLRQQAPADARAYRLSRFGLWAGLTAAPPEKAGRTGLPPPQRTRMTEIQALSAAGNHLGLLLSVESAFATSPFWLDAQRLVCDAMAALGGEFDAARQVVHGELAALILRLPGLLDLAFADGTPFAEPATRAWIGSQVLRGGGDTVGAADADSALTQALRLGLAGQVPAGLRLLTGHAESRNGERERFITRLELGDYCLRFELIQPLIALLDGLAELAERRALEDWEPQLAARLASLSWRALMHQNAKRYVDERDLVTRRARLFAKLARLDMPAAVELSQG